MEWTDELTPEDVALRICANMGTWLTSLGEPNELYALILGIYLGIKHPEWAKGVCEIVEEAGLELPEFKASKLVEYTPAMMQTAGELEGLREKLTRELMGKRETDGL